MEEIIGTLANVTIHTFDIVYDLVFTNTRVIAVNIKHPEDAPQKFTWRTTLIGEALDRREQKTKQDKIADIRREVRKNTSPTELVKLSPRNFTIHYDQVINAEVKRRFFDWQFLFNLLDDNKNPRQIPFYIKKQQLQEAQRLIALIKKSEN